MRDLAKLIGCGWLGLVFYGVGSLTTGREAAVAAAVLLAGCGLAAMLGVATVRRRLMPFR